MFYLFIFYVVYKLFVINFKIVWNKFLLVIEIKEFGNFLGLWRGMNFVLMVNVIGGLNRKLWVFIFKMIIKWFYGYVI